MISPNEAFFNPWNHIHEAIQCMHCRRYIPAHLAERWNGMTLKAARAEWRGEYRLRTKPRLAKAEFVHLKKRLARYATTTPEDRAWMTERIQELIAAFPASEPCSEFVAAIIAEFCRLTGSILPPKDVRKKSRAMSA